MLDLDGDGTTGTTGETNGMEANLDLLVNTVYRTFTTPITRTDQAKARSTLRSSGRVRDLDEAISLSTDPGNWVQTYTQQTTRQGQIDKLTASSRSGPIRQTSSRVTVP